MKEMKKIKYIRKCLHIEFLEVYLLDDPFAALISSSAKHSAIVLIFLKAASRAPVVRRYIA